ncbi:hypothetical protein SAMN04487886_10549 [Clostridium sp. DSM 8431]|nr:hypothetical protein SAMN04487886_10549 [Clostridium sp. DSM 8431]
MEKLCIFYTETYKEYNIEIVGDYSKISNQSEVSSYIQIK